MTGTLEGVSGILALSLPFGGAAYLIVGAISWYLLRPSGPTSMRTLALWVPWWMGVAEIVTYPLFSRLVHAFDDHAPVFDWVFFLKEGLWLSATALVLSYAYVALALGGRVLLLRSGRLEQPTAL
jgi:hypothetical protein